MQLAPTGLNIVSGTYMHMWSNFNFQQDILIRNGNINSDVVALAYLRTFSIGGQFAQIWLTPIWGSVSGDYEPAPGVPNIDVPTVSGFADPYVAMRIGLHGAPGLPLARFVKHKPEFQVYALVGATIPVGEYNAAQPLNLGTNRWSIRLALPMVQPLFNPAKPLLIEITPEIFLFTTNNDPFGPSTFRTQAPIAMLESHVSYNLTKKLWVAGDLRYQVGGETSSNDIPDGNSLNHSGGNLDVGYQLLRPLSLFVGLRRHPVGRRRGLGAHGPVPGQPGLLMKNHSHLVLLMKNHTGRLHACALLGALLVAACGRAPADRATAAPADGSVLPFPPVPTASVAGQSLQESKMVRRAQPSHLPKDAPNVLIILLDDVGFGLPETFGGPVHTPTLSALAARGISYNSFHTTSICSPTRAALLTGRNHQRVGSGTIAERAVDWDGYVGVMPRTSATIAKVLGDYGYKTAAIGKWHNTPADQTTAMGPFDLWPTGAGIGFDYFYGFLAGETSQWEPRLVENLNPVEPPNDPKYHLSADLADHAITWMKRHRVVRAGPALPALLGAGRRPRAAPHLQGMGRQVPRPVRRRLGRDCGSRSSREQKAIGWIPASTRLTRTPGHDGRVGQHPGVGAPLPAPSHGGVRRASSSTPTRRRVAWSSELDSLGIRDNTIVIYIWGDNGSSAEGQNGSISELLAQNQIPNTVAQQLEALKALGGLDALGGPRTDNMYNAGWAWAGDTPFRYTKLIASDFGGTRNPMVISWPARIKPDETPRSQFHHVNDIVPTLYEILGITPPRVVDGFVQDPIDGTSLAYTFADANAPGRKKTQYFDNNGSRGVYSDGWFASTFGPLSPWLNVSPGLATWDSRNDVWELFNVGRGLLAVT